MSIISLSSLTFRTGYFGIPHTINQFDVVPLHEISKNIPALKILLYTGKITFFKTVFSFIVALDIEIIHFIIKYVKRYVQQICF